MKRLRVTRPDGIVLYEMAFHEHHPPICLGKLFVENGRIVLQATGDDYGAGSVVTLAGDWVGDMAFSVSEIEIRPNDETTEDGDVLAGDGQHGEC